MPHVGWAWLGLAGLGSSHMSKKEWAGRQLVVDTTIWLLVLIALWSNQGLTGQGAWTCVRAEVVARCFCGRD
jgi:hypothetical protein